MLRALHAQPELSEKFTASLLARNIDPEEDLCDQLFNHSEKRPARVLLKLARFCEHDAIPAAKMPRMRTEEWTQRRLKTPGGDCRASART